MKHCSRSFCVHGPAVGGCDGALGVVLPFIHLHRGVGGCDGALGVSFPSFTCTEGLVGVMELWV